MLIAVTDANGITQTITTRGQEAMSSFDGSITSGNTSQTIAAGTLTRSGWLLQNTSAQTLYVEDANSAAVVGKGYQVLPGQIISTNSGIPSSANAIQVIGAIAGLTFTFRQW